MEGKRVIRRPEEPVAGSRGDPLVVDLVCLDKFIAVVSSLIGSLSDNGRTSGFLPDRTR